MLGESPCIYILCGDAAVCCCYYYYFYFTIRHYTRPACIYRKYIGMYTRRTD